MSNRFNFYLKFCSFFVFSSFLSTLWASAGSSGTINLAWNPDTAPDLAGYKLYYGVSARTGKDPKSCQLCGYTNVVTIGNVTTLTVSNLAGGQTYYFSVTACDKSNNESGFSNEISGAATNPAPTQYSLAVNAVGSGSVTKNPNKPTYNQGDQVTLTATPSSGYSFTSWTGDASGTTSPVTLSMNGNKAVTATFTQSPPPPTQYTLTANVVGSGAVTKNPNKPTYNQGDQVTLTATPGSGYSFTSWTGGASGTTSPVTLSMNGNKAVTATFTQSPPPPTQYTLTANVVGSGSVTKNPNKPTYNQGDQVTLTATPGSGYSFTGWTGDASGTTSPVTLSMNGNKAVTATFTQSPPPPTQYTLTANVVGPGSVTKNPNKPTYNQGDQVTLTATPGSGYSFTSWTGDASGTANPVTLTMNGNKAVTATFTQSPPPPTQYILTANVVGSGSVTKNPNKPTYNQGDQVTLTATPGSGYSFTSWTGDASGTTSPVTLSMNGNKAVTATFTQIPPPPTQYTLTVNVVGLGSVTKNPNNPAYNQGDQVTLTGKANQGYVFRGWIGKDISDGSNPLTLVIRENMTVTADFGPLGSFDVIPAQGLSASGTQGGSFTPSNQTYTIQNMRDIPIQWKVSKKPTWVSTSLARATLAPNGTSHIVVSINSSAKQLKPGSYTESLIFNNTSNSSDAVTRTVVLTVNPPIKTYAVKTNPAGLQIIVDGVAFMSPQTFNWEVGSSHTLDAPSFQATYQETQCVFSSWSDRKPQNRTVVASASGTSFIANFKTQYALTTSVNSAEMGVIAPAGTNWADQGQRFSITAKPNGGHRFTHWSGDVSGTNNPLSLTLGRPMNLVANFEKTGSQGGSMPDELNSSSGMSTSLPLIGALENPSDGKRVLGLKTIYGWALDGEKVSRVRLFIDAQYICDIPYGGFRDGLKGKYPNYPNADKGGFALVWDYSNLSPGNHLVQVQIQDVKGDVLMLSANILVNQISGDMISPGNPNGWLIPGINLIIDGIIRAYDLKIEWSDETETFEITDVYPK